MKNTLFTAMLAFALTLQLSSFAGYGKDVPGIRIRNGKTWLRVEAWSDNIIRVTISAKKEAVSPSFDILKGLPIVNITVNKFGKKTEINTACAKAVMDQSTGTLTLMNQDCVKFLEIPLTAEIRDTLIRSEKTFSVKQDFIIDTAEGLYGLGQHQDGVFNWHGKSQVLIQKNMEVALPFLLSTKNYGILWDNPSHTVFSSGSESVSFWSEFAGAIDFYIITAANMDGVIAGYRQLTGQVPMLPRWAYGYWQSKERYKSRREIMDVAREYRKRSIPLDVIVQDWQYWGKYGWSSMLWDESTYPDPAGMIDSLHNIYHVKYLVSVWPHIEPGCPLANEMDSAGLLFKPVCWNKGRIYDAFSEKARNIYWKHLRSGLLEKGVDGWWLDATEPELNWVQTLEESKSAIISLGRNSMGSFSKFLNPYPFFTCSGVYENQRRTTDSKRVVILTRSAWIGQQRTGAITWSGDIPSSFTSLRNQIAAGLNFSMSGNPYWNTDIGGFFPGSHGGEYPLGIADLAWRELYIRWFQFGTFCPVFRSHGTGTERELWKFGEKGSPMYESLLQWDQLRYRIMPYIYSMAWLMHSRGYTLMRGLPMDFPGDRNVLNMGDEYMFGPSFLVKPVTKHQYYQVRPDTLHEQVALRFMYDSIPVYLPAGTSWYDFFTGRRFEGGQTLLTPSPLEVLPVFIRAGSIIPYAPLMQYATEKACDPTELRIYPGADADFLLYEDENDGYGYESGKYSVIPIHWDDKAQTVTVGQREGSYPGMLENRSFKIIMINPVIPEGFMTADITMKDMKYSGTPVSLKITKKNKP
jgi:alpha-D-xyloside xylohydrolase